jgi:predicted MPP superfamily phosphohydrolase
MKKKWHLKKKYKILITILLIFTFLIIWSRYISTSGLIIKEYKVLNGNIPKSFEGLKIVHFTDVHYGRTINDKELTHFVNEVNALKPDLIFFTGDLVDKDIELTPQLQKEVTTILSNLKASIGKYAISGNHDLKFDAYDILIKDSGFININNTYDIIYSKNYETIYIAGLESEIKGKPNIEKATDYLKISKEEASTKVIPTYKILLLHTPDTLTKIKKYNFELVLAGHSHNGQVRLPFIGSIFTPLGAKKYHNPYYKINNTELYISGGLGTSNLNLRFFNKPSFNFYRLVTK